MRVERSPGQSRDAMSFADPLTGVGVETWLFVANHIAAVLRDRRFVGLAELNEVDLRPGRWGQRTAVPEEGGLPTDRLRT